jgi:hypothetical protein
MIYKYYHNFIVYQTFVWYNTARLRRGERHWFGGGMNRKRTEINVQPIFVKDYGGQASNIEHRTENEEHRTKNGFPLPFCFAGLHPLRGLRKTRRRGLRLLRLLTELDSRTRDAEVKRKK